MRGLSRQGAFLRRRVQTRVLRRRKTSSMPGQPPRVHATGYASLKRIVFHYDPRTETVVVGPVKLNQKQQDWINIGSQTVPELMEHGGVVTINERSRDGGRTWRRAASKRKRPGEKTRRRRAVYKPRPFMAVGLQQEIQAGTIPESWRNTVRG